MFDENSCCGEAPALLFELQADLRSHKCLRFVTVVRNLGNFMSHKCSRRRSSESQMLAFCYCGEQPGQYHESQMQSPDLRDGRTLSNEQFKQRVSQILTSFSERKDGERFNYYQRLLRGMPARLAKCKANKFGPCGK